MANVIIGVRAACLRCYLQDEIVPRCNMLVRQSRILHFPPDAICGLLGVEDGRRGGDERGQHFFAAFLLGVFLLRL